MIKFSVFRAMALSLLLMTGEAAHAQSSGDLKSQISDMYEQYAGMGIIAESVDYDMKLIVATVPDGRYSFQQFDKRMYENMYSTDRNVEEEWKDIPAHFNYYDGKLSLISSAPFDSARMFIEKKLDDPFVIGSTIQSLHCIWPIFSILLDQGELEAIDDQFVLRVTSLDVHVYLNEHYQITRVNLGVNQNPEAPRFSLGYSGFETSDDPLLPTKMSRAFGQSQSSSAKGEIIHEHFDLQFVQDQNQIESLLAFTDDSGEYVRKDAATDNVYDSDGNLLYNE